MKATDDTRAPAVVRRRLDRAALHGTTWMAATKWSTQVVTWASTILVARALVPSDYGLVTMAGVFLVALSLLSEFGIGLAIVTLAGISDEQVEQLNAVAMLLGVTGSAMTALAAVPLGAFFRAPDLPLVVAALGVTFVVNSVQVVPASLLRRDLRFSTLAVIDTIRSLTTAGITLACALSGLRYWSLVVGTVSGAVLGAALTLACRRAGVRWPRWRELAHVIHFGRDVLVSRLAWIAYQEGDFAVAARMLGTQGAGTYGLAWTLANSPVEKIMMTIGDVAPALFAASQSDRATLRRYFCNLTEVLALLCLPVGVGIASVSRDLVTVVLGQQWAGVEAPLALLSLYAGIWGATHLIGYLYPAVGEQGYMVRRSVLAALVLLSGFVVGSRWGATGIAGAWLVLHPLVTAFSYGGVRRSLELSGWQYVRLYRLGFDGSAVMGAVVLGFTYGVAAAWEPLPRLAAGIVLGAATFVSVTLALHGGRVRRIVEWVRQARRAEAGAEAVGSPATD